MTRAFELPDLGEGIHEAEIREVLVSAGDEVEEGDVILMVETDKAAVEVPSPISGSVQEISVEVGDLVNVGDRLMLFGDGESVEETAQKQPEPEDTEDTDEAEETAQEDAPETDASAKRGKGPVPASPATRRLARELDVALRQVPGSGPGGRVTSEDVRAYAEEGPPEKERTTAEEEEAATPEAEKAKEEKRALGPTAVPSLPDFSRWGQVEREPLHSVRRTTARKMAQAWSQIPHVSHEDIADVTELDRLRREYKAEIEADSLTLMVFVMKAVVSALKAQPRFNASLDVEAEEIILKRYYHLGTAVDTDRGLIVPVIRDVDRKSIRELSAELQAIVQRTQAGETSLEELQGGTFTITNVGPIGGTRFQPIINFPQVAILGMPQASWQPAVVEQNGQRAIEPRFRLPLILTFDHRVVDGADAARFMRHVVETLEDPNRLMLEV